MLSTSSASAVPDRSSQDASITICPLHGEDSIAGLTTLLHAAYAALGARGLNYTAVDQDAQVTQARIEGGHCFVAEYNGKLAGTITVHPTRVASECAYFTKPGVACAVQFGVDPGMQGKGIGRQLLATAEQWALDFGFHTLAVDTAEPATHLVSLYQRLGYRQAGFFHWPGKTYRSVVLAKPLFPDFLQHDIA